MPLIAAFVYPWLNAAPAVASEIKGGRALKWNVPVSALIVFILLTTSFGTMYYVGGMNFVNAALANPTLVFNYSFNFWTLAMGVANNPTLAFVIGLGWIVWNVGILAYGIIVISRYLFAQAFDRFLPTKIAYVSPRFGSPVIAHLIDLVLTIALVGSTAFLYGTLQALFGAIVAAMIYFVFVGLATTVYAARKEKGGSKVILATAGILNAIVFLFLTYEFLASPGVWGLNTLTYAYVGISFAAGAIIYLVSKSYHARRGINLSMAYKEIPPE
jgi:amino acid transporter